MILMIIVSTTALTEFNHKKLIRLSYTSNYDLVLSSSYTYIIMTLYRLVSRSHHFVDDELYIL